MHDDENPVGLAGQRKDAAALLAGESLDAYSQDELATRIMRLEAEIARVKAHRDKAAAHRLAAEAFFKPRPSGNE
jgi:uncharacterized small protein (DUF1192 family)